MKSRISIHKAKLYEMLKPLGNTVLKHNGEDIVIDAEKLLL